MRMDYGLASRDRGMVVRVSLSSAIITVSAAISKGALKLWLKDRPVFESAGGGIVDILAKFTSDLRAQRAGARQVDKIADLISINLERLIEAEYSSVPENSREAVLLAAGNTLDKARFSELDLIDRNLDPSQVQKLLLAQATSETKSFTRDENELYSRMLSEASEYILDIARQLPNFTRATLAEVLKRESSLVEKAEEIVQEVRRIGSRIPDPKSAASRFESEYLRAVGRALDYLELFGIDVSTSSKRYNLSIAYVSLSMEPAHPEVSDESELDITESQSPEDVLASHTRILLRGPAGSGKTTFMQWVAVRCASRTMPPKLASFNDKIPFFIALRKLEGKAGFPPPEEFPRQIAPLIAAEMPAGWAHSILKQGRAIFLVDGLDELTEDRRSRALTWINEIVATFPETITIVSTRPHAISQENVRAGLFSDFSIQAMSFDDVKEFITLWHQAVASALEDDAARRSLAELENKLLSTIQHHHALLRLATSPLICAMLCALNRERLSNIPRDRIELYRTCVDMFLRRDIERQISLHDYVDLSDRHRQALLEDLAYWMLKNGQSEVETSAADAKLQQKILSMFPSGSQITGQSVRRLFVERSGILRQITSAVVDFPHRSFLEYFAAQEILSQREIPFLISKAQDAHWREVAILAAGRGRPDEVEALISGVLKGASTDASTRGASILLAAACMDVAVGVSKELASAVRQKLAQAVPPRTFGDASQLAAAGELVIPYLTFRRNRSAYTNAACVRALALIKGPKAVDQISAFAADNRQIVCRELLRAAAQFLPVERYGERVITRINRQHVKTTNMANLEPLRFLRSVREMDVTRSRIVSIKPLADLNGLRRLTIGTLIDPAAVDDLPSLTYVRDMNLTFDGTHAREGLDLTVLRDVKMLRDLTLNLSQLTSLRISVLPAGLHTLSLRVEGGLLAGNAEAISEIIRAIRQNKGLKHLTLLLLLHPGHMKTFRPEDLKIDSSGGELRDFSFSIIMRMAEGVEELLEGLLEKEFFATITMVEHIAPLSPRLAAILDACSDRWYSNTILRKDSFDLELRPVVEPRGSGVDRPFS